MQAPIKIEVNEENAKEVLKRKQEGENICPICAKEAFQKVKDSIFKVNLN
jgi:DNA modification methylase